MPLISRSAIAIRHVMFEDLGLLAPILDAAGWDVSYREAAKDDLGEPSIERAGLLIVLGGPMGVYEADAHPFLTAERRLLERRLAKDLPTLGICLGSQLMAAALGSQVFAGPTKEIGWGSVTLTDEGRSSCLEPLCEDGAKVLHWHGDTFDLPNGATRLASNEFYENQAFAFGKKALALQFHLEADARGLEDWYAGHAAELSSVGVSVPDLRSATASLQNQSRIQAGRIFNRWLEDIG